MLNYIKLGPILTVTTVWNTGETGDIHIGDVHFPSQECFKMNICYMHSGKCSQN